MYKVVIISGSPNESSRLSGVLNKIIINLEQKRLKVDQIQICKLPADDLLHARFDSVMIQNANALVEQANAIIVATPIYKASYSGILKTYLDLIPQRDLRTKEFYH